MSGVGTGAGATRLQAALLSRAEAARGAGVEPLCVLDVDLTLVDNAPRNRAIWQDWCHAVRGRWAGAGAAMVAAQTMPIVFGVMENLKTLGVDDPELRKEGLKFWLRAFFSDAYCGYDSALPGAVDAVRLLREAGLTVVYLTARPNTMLGGTVRRLSELGLPLGVAGTSLVMKDDPGERDGAFKARVLSWIGGLGRPVLCADNEPGHVNAMRAAFEHAQVVLVDTRHSEGAPALDAGIERSPSLYAAITSARPAEGS